MSISKQLINGFVKSELELFKKQFDESPVPTIQDERSLAIAWLYYYFKDSISYENSAAIIKFVDDVYSKDNYSTHGWLRISAFQASAFILTSDIHYANSLIQHIDCGQSLARGFILKSASIISTLLSFNNTYSKEATETNIKYSHAYYKENIILYLKTEGIIEQKISWLENQIITDEKKYHTKFYNELKKDGQFYQSGFFVRTFSKAKSYFIFKILSQPLLAKVQATLFDETAINFNELVELENKHPLNDYYIDLSFLKVN